MHNDEFDELFPSEHNGPIGDESYQHIPESDGDSDDISIKLLFVINDHVPNIGSQNDVNADKQCSLKRVNLEILVSMLKSDNINNKKKENDEKFDSENEIMYHGVLWFGVGVINEDE